MRCRLSLGNRDEFCRQRGLIICGRDGVCRSQTCGWSGVPAYRHRGAVTNAAKPSQASTTFSTKSQPSRYVLWCCALGRKDLAAEDREHKMRHNITLPYSSTRDIRNGAFARPFSSACASCAYKSGTLSLGGRSHVLTTRSCAPTVRKG